MSDLVAFLRARLDEDEKRAQRGGRRSLPRHPRALREVEAKRSIIDGCEHVLTAPHEYIDAHDLARGVLMRLAAVYRDHPDYDPGWKT